MKTIQVLRFFIFSVFLTACAPLKPATFISRGSLDDFEYVFISQTKSLTSSSGASINGQYYSMSKSVNPRDVISGILAKNGYILIPELKDELADKTLIVNYGESGTRNTGWGSYAIEVTIQFISSESSTLISSCTAEGRGDTEADDIRQAITRCLSSLLSAGN